MQEVATMDTAYPESPLDLEDAVYPCKGCGEILEEGKAFELAGNRWHIDCFRCNTCGTLLDSDANLLLLGDGSLICNNCTYSCSSCGNKIEDLAILTGDQAFCANCFKCRNCKRKIENLRYARTSQGIFCMDCHEALMARRRKKTARGNSEKKKNGSLLDKSLPAIPPPEARKTTYIPGTDTLWSDAYPVDTPEVPSVSATLGELRADPDSDGSRPTTSPQTSIQGPGLILPPTTYRNNRASFQSAKSDVSNTANNEEFLIPLAFDPNPPKNTSPMSLREATNLSEERPRDYFNRSNSQTQAPSIEPQSSASPHIAFQEKGRQLSHEKVPNTGTWGTREGSSNQTETLSTPPYIPERSRQRTEDFPRTLQVARNDKTRGEQFKLQEAPKSRAIGSSNEAKSGGSTPRAEPDDERKRTPTLQEPIPSPEPTYSTPRPSHDASPISNSAGESPRPPPNIASTVLATLPKRGDSLESANAASKRTIPRKEVNASAIIPAAFGELNKESTSPPKPVEVPSDLTKANGGKVISGPIASPESQNIFSTPNAPQTQATIEKEESFVEPRAAPVPPPEHMHSRAESIGTIQSYAASREYSESQKSPKLPRWSGGGDFTLDEDMARILGGENQNGPESFLRRVSNSVRHGRSYSDKSGKISRDRWPRSPVTAATPGHEISSPLSVSPEHRDELTWFKNELRRERQKNIDREKKIAHLEAQLDSSANIKQVNSELREKRSTMVVLDAQKELVVRELETLTDHIAKAKASKEPLDLQKMSNSVLRDFAESLERLKNSFAPQIEEYIEKRNDLLAEVANLNTMKDKSFQEFEQLSSKNAQLAELNNQLVHQIQDIYKANSHLQPDMNRSPAPNGLGIYSHHKDKSQISIDSREVKTIATDISMADSGTTLQGEAEPISVIGGPNVVSIKKIQPKKFDWRKGQKVAKGMAKGVKGAFSSTQQSYNRDLQFAETGAYGQAQQGLENTGMARNNLDPNKPGFGFFGNQKMPGKGNGLYASSQGNASTPSLLPDPSIHLFGADLEQRAEFEKTIIPEIVIRCVEEVEERGMDMEGIYRKSGASTQVQQVKDSFEQPGGDFDLSDPDFDIHAVTSGLKQYFRKLPNPLITYDVYDQLLETTQIPEGPAQKSQRIEALKVALQELPRVHYQTLEFLIRHLAKVVTMEKENLMTPMNIAVVFAPTIMRPESINRELTDTKAKNEVVMWIVEDCEKIFGR